MWMDGVAVTGLYSWIFQWLFLIGGGENMIEAETKFIVRSVMFVFVCCVFALP